MKITKIYIALLLILSGVNIFVYWDLSNISNKYSKQLFLTITERYFKRTTIDTAIGIYIPFNSGAVNEAIKYCDSKPEKCNTLLNLSFILNPLSSYKSIKNLIPEGGQKQTEIRITIDNENYDMSWEEFKNRISQKR